MPAELHTRLGDAIRRQRMCAPGDRVAVAVSGGADSVALLLLLDELRAELGITLSVAHFHHRLRGAEADADRDFAAALARERGLEFHAGEADVAAAARRWRGEEGESILASANVEDAGRRLRYAFFDRLAAEGRAARVATAHTADDQAETVLAHILRGTGLAGLAGIYPVVGCVIRPLLEMRRAELRAYLAARGQAWREDATNKDTSRLRARIRHQLLPQLERDFQPAAAEHLAALAARAREEEVFWRALIEEKYAAAVSKEKEGWSVPAGALVSPPGTGTLPPEARAAVARRLVRRIVAEARGGARGQVTAGHVAQVLRLAAEGSSGRRLELPAGIVVRREFDRLVFVAGGRGAASPASDPAAGYEYAVEVGAGNPARVEVAETGKRYALKIIDCPPAGSDTIRSAAALDADLVRRPLVLRSWRPGDAYRPRGSRRVHKLKEVFAQRRVAGRDRGRWPVLTAAGRPVWTPGWPPAEDVAAGPGTRAVLVVEEETL